MVDVARWSIEIIGKTAVGVAADQQTIRAQVRLADPAMEAFAAVQLGVDDDPVAALHGLGAAGLDDLAEHFVTHDPRITHRNRAAVDFEIGTADAAVRHADLHPAGVLARPGDLV